MTTLPPAYIDEINTLNQEILKYRPVDVLQFCANHFNGRLESERTRYLTSTRKTSLINPFATMEQQGTETFAGFTNVGLGVSTLDGVRDPFSNSIREEDEDMLQSPTTPSFRGSLSPSAPGGGGGGSPNPNASFSPRMNAPNTGSPFLGPSGSRLSPHSAQGEFPNNYNMNRRTSVSAESMVPTTSDEDWTPPVHSKTDEQMARLKTAVAENILFRNLDEEQFGQVLGALVEKPIPAKDTRVITQGDVGDYFYIVELGSFDIYVNSVGRMMPGANGMGNKVTTIGPGGSFGELALMYNAPRAATVISTAPGNTLWALDRVTFRRILMENTFKKRRMYEAFLEEVPILSSLLPYERSKIADALETFVYEPGATIIEEGAQGDRFYILEQGSAEVYKSTTQGVVRTLGKGDYFGELALLNDQPRAASIIAKSKVKVAFLGKDGFKRLLGSVGEIMRRNDPRLSESIDPLSGTSATDFGGFDGARDAMGEATGRRAVEV